MVQSRHTLRQDVEEIGGGANLEVGALCDFRGEMPLIVRQQPVRLSLHRGKQDGHIGLMDEARPRSQDGSL